MTTMKQFRWFWAWDDEKEEAWLREMSQKGWHFKSVRLPGNYTFEQGEPRDDVYRLDFFTDRKDMVNYLQLFQDGGWEYLGEMNIWQYFRKPAVGGIAPEIFSDNASKAHKYQRVTLILVILLPIFLECMNIFWRSDREYMKPVSLIWAAWMIFYVFAMLKLLQRISQLRNKV